MNTAVRIEGVVEAGKVRLMRDVPLPEGSQVYVVWDPENQPWGPPLEKEPLTEEDIRHDIEWAKKWRWE
jgi:hypothetical protein